MKKLSIWILLAVGVAACNQNGMKTTPDGLEYKFFTDKPGETAKVGEIIKYDMIVQIVKNDKDSVLRDTRKEPMPAISMVQPSPFKGSLEEGLAMLSEGDSALFLVSADSLFEKPQKMPMPPFITKGSKIKFIIKINKISTQEELKKEEELAQVKQMQQDDQLIKDYIAKNGITDTQRTASG